MSAAARLYWQRGLQLGELLTKMEACLAAHGLKPADCFRPATEKPYRVYWSANRKPASVTAEELQRLDLASHPPPSRLSWTYFSTDELWFTCQIWLNSTPDFQSGVREGRVTRMSVSFEEEMNSWSLTAQEADTAIRKYRQLYEIFGVLGCDEMAGYSDSHYCAGTAREEDPGHIQKIFRFAKSGPQILIFPMEEGRPRRLSEADWQVFVAP